MSNTKLSNVDGCFIGRVWVPKLGPILVVVRGEEVFGPVGIVIRVTSFKDFAAAARRFVGQLTATLQMDAGGTELAASLTPILERKVGRILANVFPTGVEASNTMVHGGPYPASTNFGATSVGTLSIRRWLRPVCYQSMPESILPKDAIG